MVLVLTELLGLIVPPRCPVCKGPCAVREPLCARCESQLSPGPPRHTAIAGIDATWSVAAYEGVARGLVTELKFRARLGLASRAAAAIAERAPPELLAGEIVPVPGAPLRRRWRGFDPAEAIAVALATSTGRTVVRCLRRSEGPRQVGRPRAARVSDPPAVRLRGRAPPAAVLVDDVLTTGATLAACARALRSGGSRRVVAITFARTP